MRGTIQKGKKWYAVIYDGVNPGTGQYRRRWVQAGTKRSDADSPSWHGSGGGGDGVGG